MIIQLIPKQIAMFWPTIKQGYITANKISSERADDVGLKLLENIMKGTHQVWIGFSLDDEGKKVFKYVGITSIQADTLTGDLYLFVNALYGLRKLDFEEAAKDFESVIIFAKNNHCTKIITLSINPRVLDLMTNYIAFKPLNVYELNLEEA
jgi:hypothetical protein